MKSIGIAIAATLALAILPATEGKTQDAISSCISVATAAQLQAIKNNLSGSYCITADIDAGSISNFEPIGKGPFFTGRIFGNGHVISNLTINDTTNPYVGFIGVMVGGVVQDLGLVNANVTATKAVYAGAMFGAIQNNASIKISNVFSTGQVKSTNATLPVAAGGLIGAQFMIFSFPLQANDSWSSATVTGDGYAGGYVGILYGSSSRFYATGNVICTAAHCKYAGGAVGYWQGGAAPAVEDVFATGSVKVGDSVSAGGVIGYIDVAGLLTRAYGTGAVTGGFFSNVGSVFGFVNAAASIRQTYGVGPVTGGPGSLIGGHTGKVAGGPTFFNSYWDAETTGVITTAGTAMPSTTSVLRSGLPSGFDASAWGINKTLSFPFLNTSDQFASTLATLVIGDDIFPFMPLRQSDMSLYGGNPAHTDEASLAVVLAMMARGIGVGDGSTNLQTTLAGKYWQDAKRKVRLVGELKNHLTPSKLSFKPISAKKHLDNTNVIGPLKHGQLVILLGDYTKEDGKKGTHAMLATLYVKTSSNGVKSVVANDPWTGTQVEISPKTKKVVTPGFPLTDFVVNQYQAFEID